MKMNLVKVIEHGNGLFEHHFEDGSKQWFLNSRLHRNDGPAIEWPDGTKYWYKNGYPHREDGPAVEYPSGKKEWWINGEDLFEQKFNAIYLNKELEKDLTINDTKSKKLKI